MIKGSFNIIEFIVCAAGVIIMIFVVPLKSPIPLFAGMMAVAAMQFVRPLWFLANRRRIGDWEHVKATVSDKRVEVDRTSKFRTKLALSFTDEMGGEYCELLTAPAFMRDANEGAEYEIAFDPKQPDGLIVLELARRQTRKMTIVGIALESLIIILWVIATAG